jgi:hypothetical protein
VLLARERGLLFCDPAAASRIYLAALSPKLEALRMGISILCSSNVALFFKNEDEIMLLFFIMMNRD